MRDAALRLAARAAGLSPRGVLNTICAAIARPAQHGQILINNNTNMNGMNSYDEHPFRSLASAATEHPASPSPRPSLLSAASWDRCPLAPPHPQTREHEGTTWTDEYR